MFGAVLVKHASRLIATVELSRISSSASKMSSGHGYPWWEKRKKKKSAVPDRWENYVPYGKPIPNSRFIAFKVPLRPTIAVPETDGSLFTPTNMLDSFTADNIDVGLIVDLTFTQKYYGQDVINDVFGMRGIAYHKIFTEGHEIPKPKHVTDFQTVVSEFLDRDPHRLVGVHCTHGLNRTGYMVCRYLIERLGWEPDEAISAFDEARGHAQERQNYLEDLRKLAGSAGEEDEEEGGDDGDDNGNESGSPTPSSRERIRGDDVGASANRDLRFDINQRRQTGDQGTDLTARSNVWDRLGPATNAATHSHSPWPVESTFRPYGDRYNPHKAGHSTQHSDYYPAPQLKAQPSHQTSHRPHPYSRPPDRPVFQPYQRQDPHRVDHRNRPGGRYGGPHGATNNHNSRGRRY